MYEITLDDVLSSLYKFYLKDRTATVEYDSIRNDLSAAFSSPPSQLILMMDHLCKNGFAERFDGEMYKITYDGRLFHLNGGFQGQADREGETSRIQKQLQTSQTAMLESQAASAVLTAKLTKYLAVGAIGLLVLSAIATLWDVWKYFHSCP